MEGQKYYKVIGNNFGSFPYELGLNTLADNGEEFNSDPVCGPGGLYFCLIKDIFEMIQFGNKVCELTIPSDARVVAIGNKFKADKIFIERIFPLNIEYLIGLGADIHADNDWALRRAAEDGKLDVVKHLVEAGANFRVHNNYVIRRVAARGHPEILEFLKSKYSRRQRVYIKMRYRI